jgi:hypothetical protein
LPPAATPARPSRPPVRRLEARIRDAVAAILRVPAAAAAARAQLALPLRHGGFGIRVLTPEVADTAYLAAAALAQAAVTRPAFQPFTGALRGRLAVLWERVHAAGLPREGAPSALPGQADARTVVSAWPDGVTGDLTARVVRDVLLYISTAPHALLECCRLPTQCIEQMPSFMPYSCLKITLS